MSSSLNGTKQNIYLNMLQSLFEHVIVYMINSKMNKECYEAFINLQKSLIQNKQVSVLLGFNTGCLRYLEDIVLDLRGFYFKHLYLYNF